jgi:hypothetical protein
VKTFFRRNRPESKIILRFITTTICAGLFFLNPLFAQTPQVIYQETFENYVPQNVTGKSLSNQFSPDTDLPIGNMTNKWTTGHIQGANVNGTKCLYARCAAVTCADAPFYRNNSDADISNAVTRIGFPSSVLPAGAKLSLRFLWRFPRQNADAQAGMKLVYSTDNGLSWKEHPQSFFRTLGTEVEQANIPIDSINFTGYKINTPKLQIGFRWFNFGTVPSDSAIMVDNVQIVFEPKLEVLGLNPLNICSGDSLSVGMNISGFPAGTNFSVEYSQDQGFGSSTTLSPSPVFTASTARPSLNGSRKVRIPVSAITGAYYVRLSSSAGIFSEPLSTVLNVTKTPDKPFAGQETSVCSGADPVPVGSPNGEPGVSYSWNVPGLTGSDGELPTPFLTNNSLIKITKSVIVTASSGSGACVVQSDPMLVNIFPNPQISLAEGSDEMCDNGGAQILRFLVQPKCSTVAAQCLVSSPSASKFGNDTTFLFNPAGLNGLVPELFYRHTFRWTSTLTCSTDYDFGITVTKAPTVTDEQPESFCYGAAGTLLTFDPATGGASSRWEGIGVSPNGFFNPSASGIDIPSNQNFIKINLRRILSKPTSSGNLVCSDTAIKVVTILKAPKVNAGVDDTICQSVGELLLSNYSPIGSGTAQTNKGVWSGPGITGPSAAANAPNPKFQFNAPGTSQVNTLTYTFTDQNGCVNTDTKVIFVLPNPPASAGSDRPSCSGQAVQIGSPPVPEFGYKWLSPPAQFFLSPTTGSTASVKLFNTGANPDTVLGVLQVLDSTSGCKSKDTVRITVFPVPNATLQLPPVSQACSGDTILLRCNIAGLDTSNLIFQWLRNDFAITLPNSSDYLYPTTVSGSYKIKLGYLGAECSDTSTAVSVNFNPVIKPGIVGERTFCGNSPTTLRAVPADPAFQYEWKFYPFLNDTTLMQPVLLPGFPIAGVAVARKGLLRVSLRTDKGCADTSLFVQIDSMPKPEITNTINDTAFCNNVKALFQAPVDSSPYYKYRWLDSSNRNIVLSDSSKFYPKVAGTYYLDIYNNCGIATDTFRVIQVIPAPQFGILAGGRRDTNVCLNQNNSFDLTAPPGYQSYEWVYWDPVTGENSDVIKSRTLANLPVGIDTSYQVRLEIVDQFGCSNDDTIRVFVAQCPAKLFVPNAFLPIENPVTEQEEKNRVWFFDGYGIASAKWYIYNRWGEMVASGNNWGEPISPSDGRGWDGSFQKSGLPCPTGTYKYLIEYTAQKDNVVKKVAGNVTLIR